MRRDRPLSLAMIRKLHKKLRIPAEVLIRPGRLAKKKPRTSQTKLRDRLA
jgi:hypothetical protein